MEKLARILKAVFCRKSQDRHAKKEVKTHDLTNQCWGRAIYHKAINDGMILDAHGFMRGIEAGDYVIIGLSSGRTTRYKVDSIRYCSDPSDMWFGTLSFAPRYFTPDGVQVGE